MLSHCRQHVAVNKINIRKAGCRLPVDQTQIYIQEMLYTARIKQNAGRFFLHLKKDLGDALYDHRLKIALQDVLIREFQHREALHRSHFFRREHNTSEAAARTHENLMAAGYQHRCVGDRPCSAGRRGINQTFREQLLYVRIGNSNSRIGSLYIALQF